MPRPFAWPLLAVAALLVAACGGGGSPTASSPEAATPTASVPVIPTSARRLGTASGVETTIRPAAFDALPGAKAESGILDKAAYRIEIPDNWNGDLVLYAHGVRLFGNEVYVSDPLGPLRQLFIGQGFAWAASSYSENFYVPGLGADDSMALLRYFADKHGTPKHVYLAGESMGGNVIALLLENYPGTFSGALSVCGALGGGEEIDFLTAWIAAADYTSGVTIPVGSGQASVALTLLTGVSGALGTPEAPTARGLQFVSLIRNLTGGPRPFFLEGMSAQYQLNFGLLLFDPNRTSVPVSAGTNRDTVYHIDPGLGLTDEQVNRDVRRFDANPAARNAETHPDAVPTTGKISAPLLTLHNTGDLFVPIIQERAYYQKAKAAGRGQFLAQRIIRDGGHCKFSDAEYTTAWNDLVKWVRTGAKPAGDDLTAPFSDSGKRFTNPIRLNDPGTK